ncbi:MAG: leucyl/phenylalanyl-tRNA--protein transferase [Myxococcota bacterium]
MPVYALNDELVFPHPSLATEEGLLAVGGDLSPERMLLAYANGIFPWYSEGRPLMWWCPRPRLVLRPSELRVGRTLRKNIKRRRYRVTLDRAFSRVMAACATVPRPDQDGTWITKDLTAAFVELHRRGLAHSVEAWEGDELVGGLYGLSLGRVFFGESMFARRPDASKVAFVHLVRQLAAWDFDMVDCQVVTDHLVRFGATSIPLEDFLARLEVGLAAPTRRGRWSLEADTDGAAA